MVEILLGVIAVLLAVVASLMYKITDMYGKPEAISAEFLAEILREVSSKLDKQERELFAIRENTHHLIPPKSELIRRALDEDYRHMQYPQDYRPDDDF